MDNTKITKIIDNLGRVLIPKDLRKQVQFEDYAELEMFVEKGRIVIQKKLQRCLICAKEESLLKLNDDRFICTTCKTEIGKIENN